MSEQPTVDEQLDGLTAKVHAARGAGDRIEAQRLFAQRERLAEGGTPAVEAEPDQGVIEAINSEIPEPLEKNVTDLLMSQLREAGLDEEVDQLQQDWGSNLGANLAYAQDFMVRFAETNPLLGELVDREVERDSILYPSILRIAARMGREFVHGDHATRQEEGHGMSENNTTANDEMDRLTAEALAAFDIGDKRKAEKLYRRRDKVSERLYGGEPIVGGGGRSV